MRYYNNYIHPDFSVSLREGKAAVLNERPTAMELALLEKGFFFTSLSSEETSEGFLAWLVDVLVGFCFLL